jgi:hypothetical protein
MSERAEPQVRPTGIYAFPRLGIVTVPISKAGGTSLLRLLIAVETELESSGHITQAFVDSQRSHISAVKRPWGRDSAHFLVEDASRSERLQGITVAIVRNPFTRLASAWLNKFFMADSVEQLTKLNDFNEEASISIVAIQKAFNRLLGELRDRPDVLTQDTHLRLQMETLRELPAIDLMIGLRHLSDLPSMLEQHTGVNRIGELLMPHDNVTSADLGAKLWTESSLDLAAQIYASDLIGFNAMVGKFPLITSELGRPAIATEGDTTEIAESKKLRFFLSRTIWAYRNARKEKKKLARQRQNSLKKKGGLLSAASTLLRRVRD